MNDEPVEHDASARLVLAMTLGELLQVLDGRRRDNDRLRVGDPLPARLESDDMARIFALKSRSSFYALVARGRLDRFELRPRIGRRMWSGRLVQRYLDGEWIKGARR